MMTPLEVYEVKTLLTKMLNSLGRVESRIATPPAELLANLEVKIRQARRRHLPDHYAGDPAWEILLALECAERDERRCFICDLEAASGLPPTTVLRYLAKLEEDGYVARTPSADDRRKIEITLTDTGRDVLRNLFEDALRSFERPQRQIIEPLPAMIG